MLLLAIYFFTLNIIHENKEYLYIFFKSKSFLEMCPILKTCKTIINFFKLKQMANFFRMIDKKAKVLL